MSKAEICSQKATKQVKVPTVWFSTRNSGKRIANVLLNRFVQDNTECSGQTIEGVNAFCTELNRVACKESLETSSKLTETLRNPAIHDWFGSNHRDVHSIEPALRGYPLGWCGKMIFHGK